MYRLMLAESLFGLLLAGSIIPAKATTDAPAGDHLLSPQAATSAQDSSDYEFAAPPATDTDLIYRVDRVSGEVGACAFSTKGPTVGSTVCLPAGEGAGPQRPGNYGLIRSNLADAKGLFRINRDTGEVSVCYILNERIVCTTPVR
jgi:hypothetical protein